MRSEVYRYNISIFVAWVSAFCGLIFGVGWGPLNLTAFGFWERALIGWLLFWVAHTSIYGAWTVLQLRGRSAAQLQEYAAREAALARKTWVRTWGFKGATQLALTAGFVTMGMVIMATQMPQTQDNLWVMLLAGLSAALSWAYMVVVYATDYIELDLGEERARHFEFDHVERFGDTPIFDDYISLATFTSAAGSMSPAVPLTRKAWKHVRSNAVVAFVFNTLVIAVVVAMLTTGLFS